MADETQQTQPPVAPPTNDVDLASRINEGSSFAEIDEGNQSVGDIDRGSTQPQTPPPAPDKYDELKKELDAARTEQRLERQTILGILAQRGQQPIVVQQPEVKPAAPPPPTEEQLLDSLKKDPLGTIRNVAKDAAAAAARETEERLTGQIRNTNQRTVADLQRQDQLRAAAVEVRNEYSDLYNDPALAEEFDREAGQEIIKMYGDQWQTRLQPTDPLSAASRVYARWTKSGKLARANNDVNGGANGAARPNTLREIVRSAPTGVSNDRVTGTVGAPRNGGRTTPTTLAELGYSQNEQAAARKIMKDYGMSEATWVANYLAAQQDDPTFGRS